MDAIAIFKKRNDVGDDTNDRILRRNSAALYGLAGAA